MHHTSCAKFTCHSECKGDMHHKTCRKRVASPVVACRKPRKMEHHHRGCMDGGCKHCVSKFGPVSQLVGAATSVVGASIPGVVTPATPRSMSYSSPYAVPGSPSRQRASSFSPNVSPYNVPASEPVSYRRSLGSTSQPLSPIVATVNQVYSAPAAMASMGSMGSMVYGSTSSMGSGSSMMGSMSSMPIANALTAPLTMPLTLAASVLNPSRTTHTVGGLYNRLVSEGTAGEYVINVTEYPSRGPKRIRRSAVPRDYYVEGRPISISKDVTRRDPAALINSLNVALDEVGAPPEEKTQVISRFVDELNRNGGLGSAYRPTLSYTAPSQLPSPYYSQSSIRGVPPNPYVSQQSTLPTSLPSLSPAPMVLGSVPSNRLTTYAPSGATVPSYVSPVAPASFNMVASRPASAPFALSPIPELVVEPPRFGSL